MLFVKICIIISIISAIFIYVYGRFFLKRKIENFELLAAMGVFSKNDIDIKEEIFKKIVPALIIVVIEVLSTIMSVIGMFFIGLWYLAIIYIFTSFRPSAKDEISKIKKKKIDNVLNVVQWIILIITLIIVF